MKNQHVALIDCRSLSAYQQGHIRGSCHLPANELWQRMHELPKRSCELQLCGSEQDLQEAVNYLTSRGYKVVNQIVWSHELLENLQADGQLEVGRQSVQLWQAAALWRRFVEQLMPELGITAGKGLDIACGAGRDMIYLAEHGWDMTGVDRSEDSLQRVALLAKNRNVPVSTSQRDLEKGGDPFSDFADGSFDLITVGRYLHRPLFPYIKRLLAVNGILLYQTFMQGSELTTIGRPRNPDFLLKPGELAECFAGYELLVDEIEVLDDGRPVSAFIAQRNA